MSFEFLPIGVIRSSFAEKDDAPIQGAFARESVGTVELHSRYTPALAGIDGFSHLILLYVFDRADEVRLTRKPFLADSEYGLFAIRHPARPNPIGLTVVELLAVDGATLRVAGIDVLDGTPLLDIKPYVPRFDAFPEATEGWLAGRPEREKPAGRE